MTELVTVDFVTGLTIEAVANGSGVITATLGPVPIGSVFEIEHIAISTTSVAGTTFGAYVNQVVRQALITGSNSGNLDFADYEPPLRLTGGQRLICRWTGADVGSIGNAIFQYRLAEIARRGAMGSPIKPRPVRSVAGH